MFRTFTIGRPFGVALRVHGTTLLLAGVLALLSLIGSGLWGFAATVFLIGSVAFSVTLHELGHIGAARLFGIGTRGVTLYPFGGLASLTREARTPTEEAVVALAGPAVNVLLAGLAVMPLLLLGPSLPIETFLGVNVVLALFNLIPAYPMDGGRVLRSVLWRRLGYAGGTWWAARAGQGFAIAFAIAGLFLNPVLVLIAGVVFFQAGAEILRLRLRGYSGPGRGVESSGPVPFRAPTQRRDDGVIEPEIIDAGAPIPPPAPPRPVRPVVPRGFAAWPPRPLVFRRVHIVRTVPR